MTPDRVGIVGLGLIGGSLARDLAGRGVSVLGFDRDARTLEAARAAGAIEASLGERFERLDEIDVLLIALPVDAALDATRAVAAIESSCLVMDVGSTKRSIMEVASRGPLRSRFVGAHPLAGDHRSGWPAARAGLFTDATVYLTPAEAVTPATLQRAELFWTLVGARAETIDAAAHDEQLAWTSHLPQAVATSLARTLLSAGLSSHQLGPGGRDMTRLAASDAAMWSAVLRDNHDHVRSALGHFARELESLRRALDSGDAATIQRFIEDGGRFLDRSTDSNRSAT